jgi:Fe/S biogenesis protein NfuA
MDQTRPEVAEKFNLSWTDAAKGKILEALRSQESQDCLRVEARTNGTAEFQYAMRMIAASEKDEEDIVASLEEFEIVVDPGSAKNLDGAILDYDDGVLSGSFKFDNPNRPEVPQIGSGPRSDLTGSITERIQVLLDTEINPAVAAHGGRISLAGVKDNRVFLTFGGGCHGCGMIDVTLKQGVEARIREMVPEVEEVVDTTDHSLGENPYYT